MLRNILRLSATVKVCRTPKITQPLRCYAEEASKTAAATQMSFSFGMPGKMFYSDSDVKQIDIPSGTGTFGVLQQHVPALAVLKPGLLSVLEHDGTINKFFVSSGSVTINADSSVQVLAEMAVPLDQLDSAAVKEGLSKAQQELAAANTDLARAEAQIAIETHEAMDQAISAK